MSAGRHWTSRGSEGTGVQTGTKISGTAHLVLLGWAAFGGSFNSDPLPFEVQDVSIITAEQFAAMTASMQVPDVTATPVALTEPEPETPAPEISAEPDEAPTQATPEVASQPTPDTEPETVPDQPAPEVEAIEATPQPPAPDVVVEPLAPGPDDTPQPPPIDRVAPVPVVAPPPDATPDVQETPPVNADEGAESPQEPAEATAPEEATDQIVTEADEPASLAPTRSPRPPSRPTRPSKPTTETATSEPAEAAEPKPATQSGVNDALAEALGNPTPTPATPTGPPLTGGEKDALRVAVSSCWNVGSLSTAALGTTVVVGVSMTRQGKPEGGSIRLLSSSGGPESAAKQAYEAARRAIIRCGAKGFNLPDEKYSQWRDIEMTFNPERMRIK